MSIPMTKSSLSLDSLKDTELDENHPRFFVAWKISLPQCPWRLFPQPIETTQAISHLSGIDKMDQPGCSLCVDQKWPLIQWIRQYQQLPDNHFNFDAIINRTNSKNIYSIILVPKTMKVSPITNRDSIAYTNDWVLSNYRYLMLCPF